MTVHFIGAGPGAADLLTLRALRLIESCPVCLYAGALVPREVIPAHVRALDTSGLTLDQIVAEMADAHSRGLHVARLQSGDLSIYSAVAEQARRLDALGIPWDMTPGVPAFAAAAAALGRELTLPGVAQAVVLARHGANATAIPPGQEIAALACSGATLVIHLGAQATRQIAATLIPHYGEDCPAAVVAHASRPQQRIVRTTLIRLAEEVEHAGIRRTATIIVGRALAGECFADSHLYSAARQRSGEPHP